MTKYELTDLRHLRLLELLNLKVETNKNQVIVRSFLEIWNLPVSARFSLKMMDSRLNGFLALINSNRLETHGIPSPLSLIKSKAFPVIEKVWRNQSSLMSYCWNHVHTVARSVSPTQMLLEILNFDLISCHCGRIWLNTLIQDKINKASHLMELVG